MNLIGASDWGCGRVVSSSAALGTDVVVCLFFLTNQNINQPKYAAF